MREAVVVIGDGPAGRAAAAACAERGLPTLLVGRDPQRRWRTTYAAWVDELLPEDRDAVVAQRYDRPYLRTDRVEHLALGRPYARLDNDALQQRLRDRAAAGGGRETAGFARGVTHDADGSVVHLADGRALPAAVVIDASGHRPALARSGSSVPPAWQVAYGVVGRLDPPPVAEGGACFMDWRTVRGGLGAGPTFCYVLDLGGGLTLAEETSLAARPARPPAALRDRLERRLAGDRIAVTEQVGVERVRFPLGGPLPPRRQRVVAFGAAAGMVHPATGYQIAAALRRAPALAEAVAAAMAAPGSSAPDVARAAWGAVWPAPRVRERALYAFGLEVLLRLDAAGLQRFFEAFFALPTPRWSAYVSGADGAGEVARVMLAVAARLPLHLRARLLRHALSADGMRLAVGLLTAGR